MSSKEMYMKEEQEYQVQNFQLFKTALNSKDYIESINKSKRAQHDFLTSLSKNALSYQNILDLIPLVADSQVKSLLIIYLLSSSDYLDNLQGESIINQLKNNEVHKPSRLNALVHQLDVQVLSEDIIKHLQPEAAVSILYSIPHFHQLQQLQVKGLIEQYAYAQVVTYWLYHFAAMPNAHFMLAHLMKIAGNNVLNTYERITNDALKQAIRTLMMEHLTLFEPDSPILQGDYAEDYLIFAIQLYLNGHQEEVYVRYINLISNQLLDEDHVFSLAAMTQLLALNGRQEFAELKQRIAFITNYNLRKNAKTGDISIFYDQGIFNTHSVMQLVPLTAKTQTLAQPIAENSLIATIAKQQNTLKAIEYFLIHFQGQAEVVGRVITDFFSYFSKEESVDARSLHYMAFLLIRAEVNAQVKETLFSTFLSHPELYDEQIACYLFLYDGIRLIKYFGMQGGTENYKRVIQLSDWALNKLNVTEHKVLSEMASQAKLEAEQELTFKPSNDFFSMIFNRLKRCWLYGWTGFFKPNDPQFVLSADNSEVIPDTSEQVQIIPPPNNYRAAKNLNQLINAIQSPYAVSSLDEVIETVKLFCLQANPADEIEIRTSIHQIWQNLYSENENNTELTPWLQTNLNVFLNNRFRLLELLMAKNLRQEEDLLVSDLDKNFPHLQQILSELSVSLPDMKPEPVEEEPRKSVPPSVQPTEPPSQPKKEAPAPQDSPPVIMSSTSPAPDTLLSLKNSYPYDSDEDTDEEDLFVPSRKDRDNIDVALNQALDQAHKQVSAFGQQITAKGAQLWTFFGASLPSITDIKDAFTATDDNASPSPE